MCQQVCQEVCQGVCQEVCQDLDTVAQANQTARKPLVKPTQSSVLHNIDWGVCQDSLRSVSTSVSRSVSRTGKVCQEVCQQVCQQVCQDVDTVTPLIHKPLVKLKKKNTIVIFPLTELDWLKSNSTDYGISDFLPTRFHLNHRKSGLFFGFKKCRPILTFLIIEVWQIWIAQWTALDL